MEITKNYLTIEEIANTVDQMTQQKMPYNREIIKTSLVTQYCTNVDVENKTAVEIYNLIAENGMLEQYDYKIHNYYMIDKMVNNEMGIEKSVNEFLDSLNVKVDNVIKKMPKDFNLKDFFSGVKKAVNDGKNIL